MKEISEPKYSSVNLCQNWKERTERSFVIVIDIGGGEPVVSLNLSSRAVVDTYKRSITCHTTVLVELMKAHSESADGLQDLKKMEVNRRYWGRYPLTAH